jgi:hypothetical protein
MKARVVRLIPTSYRCSGTPDPTRSR